MTNKHRMLALAVLAVASGAVFASLAGLGTAARQAPPVNTAPPSITGTAQQSQTLTAQNGTWTGAGTISFRYQWLRCNQNGNGCTEISGATERTYTLRGVDVGNTIHVRVIATNADGSTTATSGPTALVTRSGPSALSATAVRITSPAPPRRAAPGVMPSTWPGAP